MKATGIARPVDDLGRIVIPKEIRRSMHIKEGDFMELSLDGENLILSPCRLQCVFCGKKETQEESLIEKNGILVCAECAKELTECAEERES